MTAGQAESTGNRAPAPPPRRQWRSPCHRAFLILIPLLLFLPAVRAATVMVVNPGTSTDHITRSSARLLFSLRRSQWRDGRPVRVFVLPDNDPVHREFVRHILGLYPRQLRRVWDRQTYSGTGQAPETVSSPTEMREKIATMPGSIGYLPKEMVDESVKPIEVQ